MKQFVFRTKYKRITQMNIENTTLYKLSALESNIIFYVIHMLLVSTFNVILYLKFEWILMWKYEQITEKTRWLQDADRDMYIIGSMWPMATQWRFFQKKKGNRTKRYYNYCPQFVTSFLLLVSKRSVIFPSADGSSNKNFQYHLNMKIFVISFQVKLKDTVEKKVDS